MRHDTTTRPDLEIIEALDFEHTPQCEHSNHGSGKTHGGPAHVLAQAPVCPDCGSGGVVLYLCKPFWSSEKGVYCGGCRYSFGPRAHVYKLIAYANGS